MAVAAVILAAGHSRRFGDGQKLVADFGGVPVIRRVASAIGRSRAGDIILVVPAGEPAIAEAAGAGRWRIVEATDTAAGLSVSLRMGLREAGEAPDGVLVALGDMPGVTSELTDALIGAFELCRGRSIVFPQRPDGRRGHPVIWPIALSPELMAITGDSGGKSVLERHPGLWHPWPTQEPGAFDDIDTREDLDRLRRSLGADRP